MPDDADDRSPLDEALHGLNAGYVAAVYEQYRLDPASVDPDWRRLFDAGFGEFEPVRQERSAVAAPEPVEPPPGAVPLKGPAARLAANMTASLAVPTATSFRDVDASVLETRRHDLNERAAARRISFTHLIGFALARAAVEQPGMTAAYVEAGGQPFRLEPERVNLGLAVDVERGESRLLVVPVIHDAGSRDFAAFHARYEELVAGARDNRLSADDYTGANMTLTNPGTLGTTA